MAEDDRSVARQTGLVRLFWEGVFLLAGSGCRVPRRRARLVSYGFGRQGFACIACAEEGLGTMVQRSGVGRVIGRRWGGRHGCSGGVWRGPKEAARNQLHGSGTAGTCDETMELVDVETIEDG